MSFKKVLKFVSLLTLITIIGIGCSGSNGKNGTLGVNGKDGNNGAPGLSTGNISGTVVDSASQTPIAGATVAINPAVAANVSTDTNGKFSFSNIPIGPYQVIVSASGYNQLTSGLIAVVAGVTATTQLMIVHGPYQAPLITWPSNYYVNAIDVGLYNVGYGKTVNISANVSDPNYSSSALTYTWTVTPYPQYGGAETLIPGANTVSISFTTDSIPNLSTINYMYSFLNGITPDQGRDSIIPIGPMQVGLYRIELYATNPAGVQGTASIMVRAASKTAGIENVPVGVPVYMSFTETNPNIQFAKPGSSSAVTSTVSASPYTVVTFTPDKGGIYYITETTYGNNFTIIAGTWVGVGSPVSNGYSNCVICHNGTLTGNFAPWSQSPHASMFKNGINGLLGNGSVGPHGYEPIDAPPFDPSPINQTTNEVCLSCHTVGYDQAQPLANNGFNNAMKILGWIFPTSLISTNWTNMAAQYPTLTALANIQCENCHGPSNSFAHMTTNLPADTGPRIGWDAGVCMQCHDSEGPDWAVSPHGYLALSISEATIQNSGNAAHCGRCHAAQGFNEYLGEVGSGTNNGTQNIFSWASGITLTTDLATIGLTVQQVQPQTCQMCHDGHSPANPYQLKLYANTFTLAAGFTAQSVGAGAICMECHNTRNGEHDDSTGISGYSAPHTPSQSDMLEGQNSYFTNVPNITYLSKHANIADTCVTCHMAYNPNNPGGAPSSHVWTINSGDKGAICQNCHGVGTTGDGLQTEVDDLLATLDTQIGKHLVSGINLSAATYDIWINNYNPATGQSTPAQIAAAGSGTPITSVSFYEIHGQIGFLMISGTTTYYSQMGNFITMTAGIPATSANFSAKQAVFPLNGSNPSATTLVKACWNYGLVEGDGSLGIHNPTYILTILDDSIQQLP